MGLTPLVVVLLFLGIAAAVNMKAQHGGKSVLPTRTLPTDMLEVKRAAKEGLEQINAKGDKNYELVEILSAATSMRGTGHRFHLEMAVKEHGRPVTLQATLHLSFDGKFQLVDSKESKKL